MALFPRVLVHGTHASGAVPVSSQSATFVLPAGVTLVDIDGGQNFFTRNGFTYAAAAGMDTTLFPMLDWLQGMNPAINPGGPARILASGCNMIAALDSNANANLNALQMVQAQPGLYLAQGSFFPGNGTHVWLANAGNETVWVFLDDEPGAWNDPTGTVAAVDIVTTMAGTHVSSVTPVAGFQTGRPIWANMFHSFFDSPPQNRGYPALCPGPLGNGVNCPSGLMTPAEVFATPTPNNDSINRHIEITGSDYYWMTTDLDVTDGSQLGGGACYGMWDFGSAANGGTSWGTGSYQCTSPQTITTLAPSVSPNNFGPLIQPDAVLIMIGSFGVVITNATWAATGGGQATFTTASSISGHFTTGTTNIQVSGINVFAISNATWSSGSGGQATYTTTVAHGIGVGISVDISGIVSSGPGSFDGTLTTVAGTTGSTIVVAMATNPGTFNAGQSNGSVVSHDNYNGTYTALAGTTGSTIVVALATQPGEPTYVSGGSAVAFGNMQGHCTSYTPGTPGNAHVNIDKSTGSNATFNNYTGFASLSTDQTQRGCRYGDQIDMLRPYSLTSLGRSPTPLIALCENGAPGNTALYITPVQMKAIVWASIIHGARGITYFSVSFNTSVPGAAGSNTFGIAYYQQIQSGNTISIFDMAKATGYLIQTLCPVLLSFFAEGMPGMPGYVTVTGDNLGGSTPGARAPYRPAMPATINERGAYPYTGGPGVTGTFPYTTSGDPTVANPAYNFNATLHSCFEVMAKLYQGPTIPAGSNNGVALTKNKFWLFAEYRGSQNDGILGSNANTLIANFTLNNSNGVNAPSVTRIYSDAILGAAAASGFAGTRTTITCGDTSQMNVGDTVIIAGTTGVPGLNGTFTIQSSNFSASPPTFDILLAFSGTFTFQIGPDTGGTATCGAGTIIALHDIAVTGGTTFSDEFKRGTDIRIYRVN